MKILHGDCREVLSAGTAESIDAIVTDPPYGLSFMGKGWDHGVPGVPFWTEALRVLKPGGHLVAFGGTRTYHRLACAIEDAGFEIRDCLMWLYGTGFPKSLNVSKAIDKAAGAERIITGQTDPRGKYDKSTRKARVEDNRLISTGSDEVNVTAPATDAAKQWDGWGTALKPAWEPIILARKPLAGTVAANVTEHGTGALNVDGCRVASGTRPNREPDRGRMTGNAWQGGIDGSLCGSKANGATTQGRWPANVVLDEEAGEMLDEQSGERQAGAFPQRITQASQFRTNEERHVRIECDSGGASRFFYCAKASKKERGEGNTHPTVKPQALMRWLVRLITPPGGKVLDPFMGSGSTGVAALAEGFEFIGIDQSEEYVAIAERRLDKAGTGADDVD